MNPTPRQPCRYFQRGNCKFGEKCSNEHIPSTNSFQNLTNQPMPKGQNPQQFSQNPMQQDSNPNSNICRYFLLGKCNNDPCR